MKTDAFQNQSPERFARPARVVAPDSARARASEASSADAARRRPSQGAASAEIRASDAGTHHAARDASAPVRTSTTVPALAQPRGRGLPAGSGAPALRAKSLQQLRRSLAQNQRLSAADHAWSLFATLPTEVPRAVALHAAAYLRRLTAPVTADVLPAGVAAARAEAQALYQGPIDFMACVIIASKIAGNCAHAAKPREWLMTFRAALELHRSALGYQAQLPAVDAEFIFAAEASVGARLNWNFKVSPEAQDQAAGVLRTQAAATAGLTHLWDLAEGTHPHEETFRKLLSQCLLG